MATTRRLREHEPGGRRDDRRLPALGRRGRRPRGRGGEGGVRRAGGSSRRRSAARSSSASRSSSSEEKAALTDLMTHEMGKVKAEAGGDVQEAIDITYYMAGEGRRLFGQTTPSELQNKWNMSVRLPIGVVGAITPWNFPIAIPSWKIDPGARLREHGRPQAGRGHAGARAALRRAADSRPASRKASSTSSTAAAATSGDRLVRHPDVPVITLTGSRETGVEVLRRLPPTRSSTSISSSAARTRSSSSTTPTSTSRSTASSGRRSARRASAAPPRRA